MGWVAGPSAALRMTEYGRGGESGRAVCVMPTHVAMMPRHGWGTRVLRGRRELDCGGCG